MTGASGVDIRGLHIHENQSIACVELVSGRKVSVKFQSLAFVGVFALLALPGCAALPGLGPAALDTYDLTPPPVAAAGGARSRTQLLIAEPSALRSLDAENIVVRTSPGSIEFLSGAQWADRLPRIVQARLADAFQATGRLGGVGRPGEGLAIDYQLVSDIRAFEVRVFGQRRATVEISVRLLDDRNGVVRATRVFQAEVPLTGTGNDAYIAALDRAHQQMAAELVPWVLAAI
ncbi:ABC transporter [Chelativorans sp. ZYF759]|uniref:ABC-type transport auxiliary lipoprotein family protein n=1 Tax=Chelativorans sp. ZYF759 TaxID=2692213 RepID=UPI00145F6D3A|nr:ABC-type transport auxiliary lipoprotein family protein [Chelativorans sp. ZYF759]NMG38421.1 ABC transporter [Chelativorans sp. ZYF759]